MESSQQFHDYACGALQRSGKPARPNQRANRPNLSDHEENHASLGRAGGRTTREWEACTATTGRPAALALGRPVYRAGTCARIGLDRVPVDPAYRHRPLVERQHHRAQFHSSALFPVLEMERGFLELGKSGAGNSTAALARPPLRASRRPALALALVGAACVGNRLGSFPRVWAAGARAGIFSNRLPAWLARWPRPVPTAGTPRARTRHDEPLRPALQSALL